MDFAELFRLCRAPYLTLRRSPGGGHDEKLAEMAGRHGEFREFGRCWRRYLSSAASLVYRVVPAIICKSRV